jgi:hypothetical protein
MREAVECIRMCIDRGSDMSEIVHFVVNFPKKPGLLDYLTSHNDVIDVIHCMKKVGSWLAATPVRTTVTFNSEIESFVINFCNRVVEHMTPMITHELYFWQ